jgi:hypothetical protein
MNEWQTRCRRRIGLLQHDLINARVGLGRPIPELRPSVPGEPNAFEAALPVPQALYKPRFVGEPAGAVYPHRTTSVRIRLIRNLLPKRICHRMMEGPGRRAELALAPSMPGYLLAG